MLGFVDFFKSQFARMKGQSAINQVYSSVRIILNQVCLEPGLSLQGFQEHSRPTVRGVSDELVVTETRSSENTLC